MRIRIAALPLIGLLAMAFVGGCESETPYGKCVGALDEDLRQPGLIYKLSARNLAIGGLFFGLVVPPVYVLVDQTFCPVARKN